MYSKVWQSPCNLSTKLAKDLKSEITIQYLTLLNLYVDTIFVLPDLGTDQGMSTKLGNKKYLEILHKLT